MPTLGLIAGNGRLPFLVARAYKEQPGHRVVAVGFKGDTDPSLAEFVDEFAWIGVGQLGRLIRHFKAAGAEEAVMAGQITPARLFSKIAFDVRGLKVYAGLKDRKADTIFAAVARELDKDSIRLVESTRYLDEHLPAEGVLTKRQPAHQQLEDVAFGAGIARELGRLDVGQAVVVKDRAVVAVEAIEGTNETIARGGRLGGAGVVVVKMAKPDQDLRFDVPVIGPKTIEAMVEAKAALIAIEAKRTFLVEEKATLAAADAAGICVMAIPAEFSTG
ncbi:MAG: UDP-2,3-diacylglucosamine diphosphatase LpxI [Verrucomicrobia bacterium]|nr:UDP-2,3-diacylglucosamine diphosphatase LpxI [Verrucomicrobiota bacterium]